jgi:hypothetical protein
MGKRLIDTLQDVIEAEHLAVEFRRTHGADAERYCDGLIEARSWKELDREQLEDVRRALRWV